MGCYDTFGAEGTQLKAGECLLRHYSVGDKVGDDFSDGVYVSYEGMVVIKDGVFVAEFTNEQLFNKWGGLITINLDEANPVAIAVNEFVAEREKKESGNVGQCEHG